jgi:hypothetical protein
MKVPYERTHPKKIVVVSDALRTKGRLQLNEKYDPLWQAVHRDTVGQARPLARDESVQYANAWKVDQSLPPGKIEIIYLPMRLFPWGLALSFLGLLGILAVLGQRARSLFTTRDYET